MQSRRSTPCVGICSTTFGDLVCRGCKRFAHEVVDWNSYEAQQQKLIWQRLASLRDGAVLASVRVQRPSQLDARAQALGLETDGVSGPTLIHELLQRLPSHMHPSALGLVALSSAATLGDLQQDIDQEFFRRSQAWYERSFRTLAR